MNQLFLHRTLAPLNAVDGLALAIGNFDGMHRGHQAILQAIREASNEHALTPAAMSFEPLPREYFGRIRCESQLPLARLMSLSEKLARFVRAGMRHAFIPRFDSDFAGQSPDQFIATLAGSRFSAVAQG